jgi:excisionase family DNA binding protein
MTTLGQHQAVETSPSLREVELARTSSLLLAACLAHGGTAHLLVHNGDEEVIEIPISALRMLLDILSTMAEGKDVSIMRKDAELTTQMAADLLNVSRPYLVSLIEGGHIPFHKTGTHRRLKVSDVLAYKQRRDTESLAALEALTADAQELDMSY